METTETFNELLNFFKTLSDKTRLRIIGLLAEHPLSVEDLAEKLDLSSSTISHHLSRLSKAGLVSARAEGYYNIYQLETKNLEEMSERMLSKEILPKPQIETELDSYDQKVLKTYLDANHRIKSFPNKSKKIAAILRYVVKVFEPEKQYTEKEVNALLSRFSDDTAFLRRNLCEYGMMNRQGGGGLYWRTHKESL